MWLLRSSRARQQPTGRTPRFPIQFCSMGSPCREDPLSSRRTDKSGYPRGCRQRHQFRFSASRSSSRSYPNRAGTLHANRRAIRAQPAVCPTSSAYRRLPPARQQVPAAKPAPKWRLSTLRENAVEISESDSERFPRPRLQLSSEQAEVRLDYILPIGLETTFGLLSW